MAVFGVPMAINTWPRMRARMISSITASMRTYMARASRSVASQSLACGSAGRSTIRNRKT